MKKLITALLITLVSVPAFAGYWYAEAHSDSAWGWGQSPDKYTAQNIAMNECVKRTPYWDVCYISTVYWTN